MKYRKKLIRNTLVFLIFKGKFVRDNKLNRWNNKFCIIRAEELHYLYLQENILNRNILWLIETRCFFFNVLLFFFLNWDNFSVELTEYFKHKLEKKTFSAKWIVSTKCWKTAEICWIWIVKTKRKRTLATSFNEHNKS